MEGRSRAYINGTPVPLTQLKALGQLLINIHGQHAHQLLLKPEHQLTIRMAMPAITISCTPPASIIRTGASSSMNSTACSKIKASGNPVANYWNIR